MSMVIFVFGKKKTIHKGNYECVSSWWFIGFKTHLQTNLMIQNEANCKISGIVILYSNILYWVSLPSTNKVILFHDVRFRIWNHQDQTVKSWLGRFSASRTGVWGIIQFMWSFGQFDPYYHFVILLYLICINILEHIPFDRI